MKIRLHKTYADRFTLESSADGRGDGEREEPNLSLRIVAQTEPSKFFSVMFELDIALDSASKSIRLLYVAEFESDEDMTVELIKESSFANVNAPAIGYPFLRSFLATVLLNAGYEPVLLPAVNFQALYSARRERKHASPQVPADVDSAAPIEPSSK